MAAMETVTHTPTVIRRQTSTELIVYIADRVPAMYASARVYNARSGNEYRKSVALTLSQAPISVKGFSVRFPATSVTAFCLS